MKIIVISVFLTLTSIIVNAQDKSDTVNYATKRMINAEFPRTRMFNLEYDHSFSRDFESKLFDKNFQTGDINSQKTVNFTANIPFYHYKRWLFSANGTYKYSRFNMSDVENTSNNYPFRQIESKEFNKFTFSLNSTLYSSMFKKPLIYNGSLILDGSEKGFQRFKYFIAASLVLKKTELTTMTIGLVALLDPTSQIPFVPTYTYNQKFRNSKWEFDLILPQRLMLRRAAGRDGRFSVLSTFESENYYFNGKTTLLPNTYEYSQLKINGGVMYEHKLSNQVIITLQGGVRKHISNRFTEKGKLNKDYVYKNSQDVTGYFNVGISFNPF